MDGHAAREARPEMRAEWIAMASHWRGLAHTASWQDHHPVRSC
jgi:hypothetical protein